MTEDHTFFPRVSALITVWLLALPHLYKCQSKVHRSLWKRVPQNIYIVLIVRQQDIVIQNPCIWGHPHPSFFFCLWQVMCAVITHAHYHISFTFPGISTLIFNILIAAGSYILLSLGSETISRHLGLDNSLNESSPVRSTVDPRHCMNPNR